MPMGEFELIGRLIRPLARGCPAALDLGDDAALLDVPDAQQLVLAKDAMIEGVHFLADDPPELIAGKILRVNLSDLAAMGADPLGYLMVLGRPRKVDDAWLESFYRGLAGDQERFGLHLMGGDTVSTPGPLTLSLTILGLVPRGQALLRRGARPGDDIWVSGTLGDAALGLRILRGLAASEDEALELVDRYRTPRPRLALGRGLRGIATAALDVSDGLLADLGHILEQSKVGAELRAGDLPISADARSMPGALDAALAGGDDYELLFTVPGDAAAAVERASRDAAVTVTRIGRIEAQKGLRLIGPEGRPMHPRQTGWRHF